MPPQTLPGVARDFAAVIRPEEGPGRSIDERIDLSKAHGSEATLEEDFAKDL